MNNPIEKILESLGVHDGEASNLAGQLVDVIAKLGKQIQDHASSYGLRVDPRWLSDIDQTDDISANLEIQLGRKRAFPNSEVITVKAYDTNNFKVILTDNIRRALNLGDTALFTFQSIDETLEFLGRIYNSMGAVPSNT